MQVIEYHNCDRQEYWLEQIKKSDWSAGRFLYELLKESKFFEMVGEKSRVMLLVDGDDLISFCTYAEKDDIQPTELTPWIGLYEKYGCEFFQTMYDRRNGEPCRVYRMRVE